MVRLYLEEGRTIKSQNEEYKLGDGTVRKWVRAFREECEINPKLKDTKDLYEENRKLRKELEEQKKEFENQLNREFHAEKPNEKWCTDFTYIMLEDGRKRYNCSIMDLYDRSVVATLNSSHIDTELAIRTLE